MTKTADYRKKLKKLRLKHGLTQKYVGELCGVSDATVGHWENLKRNLSIDCLVTLCAHYGVSADYVLGLPQYLDYPEG